MSDSPRNFPQYLRAVIFDFDETMIDLERQHTAAYERLAQAMGADYKAMPESFRTASGKRIIDDIREMRAFFAEIDVMVTPGWETSADPRGYASAPLLTLVHSKG